MITPYFPPALGGACRMLGGIANSLAVKGHSVTVLTLGLGSAVEHDHDDAAKYRVVRVQGQWQNLKTVAVMGVALDKLLAQNRYDLIFCGTAYSSAALAYLATRVRATPYVVYSHGEDVTIVGDSGWKHLLLKRALQASSHTFANSGFTRAALERAGAIDVETLHPSIDASLYLAATDERAARLVESVGLEGRAANLLITVARLQERKGHDVVVRALPMIAQQVHDVHYLIEGKGERSRLLNLAEALGVRNRVTIVESLSESELADAYRASKLNVLVSHADANKERCQQRG
jgi:phosphatidylinositol alpha-1,6-mannosyltransferase